MANIADLRKLREHLGDNLADYIGGHNGEHVVLELNGLDVSEKFFESLYEGIEYVRARYDSGKYGEGAYLFKKIPNSVSLAWTRF